MARVKLLNLYYYTEAEAREIIRSMVVLIDTREKENHHIVEYLEKKKIAYKTRALPAGDYSVMIPENRDLGIMRDIYLNLDKDGGILIERKNSAEELAGNLGRNRDRFENELEKMKGAEKHLIVERGTWEDIFEGRYNSMITSSSYRGSLITFMSRYGLHVHFVGKQTSPAFIVELLGRKIKETLNI